MNEAAGSAQQKLPSTSEPVTLTSILSNDGIASVLIKTIEIVDKRSLRLVCHAAKDAIDRTVATLTAPYRFKSDKSSDDIGILVNSNWKHVKKIDWYDRPLPIDGIKRLAEGGFSKLESLMLSFDEHMPEDASSAESVIQAGWKLKRFRKTRHDRDTISPEWFGLIMRNAKWPLEELILPNSKDAITDIIGDSDWPLKSLDLSGSTISAEGMRRLMQGSWVSTIECLDLNCADIKEEGFRAIAEASHRAPNLVTLYVWACDITDKEALILAQGSYPKIKSLDVTHSTMSSSGLVALLKKCPVLDDFKLLDVLSRSNPLDDPADAKFIAQRCKSDKGLYLEEILMTKRGARSFFAAVDWPNMELVDINNDNSGGFTDAERVIADEAIAAFVQLDCPCLKHLIIRGVTPESNIWLSRKKWPVTLERLELRVELPGIELDTAKLPGLKELTLQGNKHMVEAVKFISTQEWPHLTELTLDTFIYREDGIIINYDIGVNDSAYPFLQSTSKWALKMLQGLNTTRMPSLKMLTLSKLVYSEREKLIIKWAARNGGGYDVEWF